MAEVVWTARARTDLASIGDYVALSSPAVAAALLRRLLTAVERLGTFPESGRVVPVIGDDAMCEIVYRNYRVVYLTLLDEDRVEVLTVFHASRQFGGLPGESSPL